MLVDHTEPRSRTIGSIHLIPGINKIDDKRWDHLLSKGSKWKKPIEGLISAGVITVEDARKKLTIAMVEKTYDVPLLDEWNTDPAHRGPLKGAIKKQIKAMEIEAVI